MCVSSNAEVQSSWDNVKTSKNPIWTICQDKDAMENVM